MLFETQSEKKGEKNKEKENVENSKVIALFFSTSFASQVHFVIGRDEILCKRCLVRYLS